MMFAVSQTGGRLAQDGVYYKYPFKETLNFTNVAVFQLNKDEQFLSQFEKNKIKFVSPVKRERENAGRLKLEANKTYVIVPSCETPETVGEIFVSIYIDCQLH